MKGKLTALLMAMAVVLLAVTAGLAAKVLFEDKFTTLERAWYPGPNIGAKDGKLFLTSQIGRYEIHLNGHTLPNDMEASYTMAVVKAGDPRYGGGLVFWAKRLNTYYFLDITVEGKFAVLRDLSGRLLIPVAWREDASIKKGIGAENQVKVVTKGNQATIFINGKQVVSFSGQPPEGGSKFGVQVDSGPLGQNIVAFSNFKVLGH